MGGNSLLGNAAAEAVHLGTGCIRQQTGAGLEICQLIPCFPQGFGLLCKILIQLGTQLWVRGFLPGCIRGGQTQLAVPHPAFQPPLLLGGIVVGDLLPVVVDRHGFQLVQLLLAVVPLGDARKERIPVVPAVVPAEPVPGSVADIVLGQVPPFPGQADQLPLPLGVGGSCSGMGGQLHQITATGCGIVFPDGAACLGYSCKHRPAHCHLNAIRPAGWIQYPGAVRCSGLDGSPDGLLVGHCPGLHLQHGQVTGGYVGLLRRVGGGQGQIVHGAQGVLVASLQHLQHGRGCTQIGGLQPGSGV